MVDNNYNIIKPVEGLQNVGNINPAGSREEKRKRQNPHKQEDGPHKPVEDELSESIEKNIDSEIVKNDQNEHFIDYRA